MTNSYKHADFGLDGLIKVSLTEVEGACTLRIHDNGRKEPLRYKKEGSLGSNIINGLADSKLNGHASFHYDKGTILEVEF